MFFNSNIAAKGILVAVKGKAADILPINMFLLRAIFISEANFSKYEG